MNRNHHSETQSSKHVAKTRRVALKMRRVAPTPPVSWRSATDRRLKQNDDRDREMCVDQLVAVAVSTLTSIQTTTTMMTTNRYTRRQRRRTSSNERRRGLSSVGGRRPSPHRRWRCRCSWSSAEVSDHRVSGPAVSLSQQQTFSVKLHLTETTDMFVFIFVRLPVRPL